MDTSTPSTHPGPRQERQDTAPSGARPPGPSARWLGLPLLREMSRDYLGFMGRLHQRHGDLVYMRLMHYRDYSLAHPDQIRELLIASHDHLVRWKRGIEVFTAVHGHSVLTAEGEDWKRRRQMLQPSFNPRQVEAFVPLMTQAADTALRRWDALSDFAFEHAMTQLTMDVILRSLFSHNDEAQSRRAADAVHQISVIAMREMYWPVSAPQWAPWKAPKREALRVLEQLVLSELARRRERPEAQADLLQHLLQLRDEQGQPLSPRRLRDECMTTFLAGHETSAAALTWWGWCMAAHPQAQARAIEEVDQVLQGRVPTAEDLPRLRWLGLCVKEVLRLYPPAPALFARTTTAPIRVGDYELPPGANVRLTPAITQRDPRWFEEPETFRPERFDPASGHAEIPRGAWLPFGAGPRVCLGSHFALTEITLIAAMILQRHRLTPVPGAPTPRPVLNIMLRPAQPLRLRLVRR
ncbi:cytochrome P450 [Pelomonas sp. CA6]|uniref:cytochrome P450 n=1 Tax=Pelomonas sp. CA6 TaxID=2907999 RepID=UPI001F4C27DF|nr:cytochrome P450 [Pelomonas sp. CA6]MCH7345613.1 cytochrome P450 [Pelomonas sp. CA6]